MIGLLDGRLGALDLRLRLDASDPCNQIEVTIILTRKHFNSKCCLNYCNFEDELHKIEQQRLNGVIA